MGLFDFFKRKKEKENSLKSPESSNSLDFDMIQKKKFIYLESAYQNQELIFRWSNDIERLTLGELIKALLKIDKSAIELMAISTRMALNNITEESILKDPEVIWNFDLFSCILKKKNDGHYTMGMYHKTTLIIKTTERNIILILNSLGGSQTMKYMRVSLMSPDNSQEDDGHSFQGENTGFKSKNLPLISSLILSYSEIENNPEVKYYMNIEESVDIKSKKGEELNEIEREYIHGKFQFSGYEYFGYGKWLLNQNRYFDAYTKFHRLFNFMIPKLNSQDIQQMNLFYETCKSIGICLSKINREEEACYFNRLAAPSFDLNMSNPLILSHAKLGNPIAIQEMHERLMIVAQKYGNHDNWPEEIKEFGVEVPVNLIGYKKKFEEEIAKRPQYIEGITIGFVLNELWGIRKKNISPSMIIFNMENNSFETVNEKDSIFDYNLSKESSSNKVFVLSVSHAHYITGDEIDKSILCHNAPLVISTHSIKGKETTSKIRVDMIRQNFSENDDNQDLKVSNTPLNATFTLGFNEGDSFTYDKESFIEGYQKTQRLISEKRFIEAYKLSRWLYECVLNLLKGKDGLKFESEDDTLHALFFELSYNIGYCLMELGKAREACYYLEISSYSGSYQHAQEYINCLNNTHDPQALEVVENVIENSPKPEDETNIMAWNYHMAFLKRRKSYLLVESKRYYEAKQLLEGMLNDPLCAQFAKNELAYLSQLHEKSN